MLPPIAPSPPPRSDEYKDIKLRADLVGRARFPVPGTTITTTIIIIIVCRVAVVSNTCYLRACTVRARKGVLGRHDTRARARAGHSGDTARWPTVEAPVTTIYLVLKKILH